MTKARASAALGLFLVSLAAAAPAAAQWGQFRGPNGAGVDAATGYPTAFSPTDHVVWKAALPFAQSSPVVVGSQVYVTTSEGGQLLTVCLDAATGRERWRRAIQLDQSAALYKANDPASPTPVADNEGVVVFFARRRARGLRARRDRALARRRSGPSRTSTAWPARRSSPATPSSWSATRFSGSFMVAVDRRTGREPLAPRRVPASRCRGRRRWCSRRAAALTRS